MRTASVGALVISLFTAPAVTVQPDAAGTVRLQDDAARTVLRQARDALGGPDALEGVRARQYAINGERRSFALLRPTSGDVAAQERIRDLVLDAYA